MNVCLLNSHASFVLITSVRPNKYTMKSINSILVERKVESTWRGSEKTAEQMRQQVKERFGDKAAKEYDAKRHVMSLKQWGRFGIKIKAGETALKTYTVIENDDETGEAKRVRRSIPVFHYLQTDLATSHE